MRESLLECCALVTHSPSNVNEQDLYIRTFALCLKWVTTEPSWYTLPLRCHPFPKMLRLQRMILTPFVYSFLCVECTLEGCVGGVGWVFVSCFSKESRELLQYGIHAEAAVTSLIASKVE